MTFWRLATKRFSSVNQHQLITKLEEFKLRESTRKEPIGQIKAINKFYKVLAPFSLLKIVTLKIKRNQGACCMSVINIINKLSKIGLLWSKRLIRNLSLKRQFKIKTFHLYKANSKNQYRESIIARNKFYLRGNRAQ